MYLPGFPDIAKDLNTDTNTVALSLSSYFIGISAGQLLYGPLLDRFGRKKPLYIGLLVYILASAGCLASHHINSLIAWRFVQAIGSCAAAVASVAMVRDLFPVKDTAKVFALLMLVVGASPMLAPTIGGYITTIFGWQAVFIILGALGLAMLGASIWWLPDGFQPDTTLSLKPRPILRNFWDVLRVPQFYTYTLTGATAFSGLFAYVAGSPDVFMKIYHLNAKTYGWIFAFLSIGLIGSSQVNSWLLKRFRSQQIIPIALTIQCITSGIFTAGALSGSLQLWSTITLLFAFLCTLGLINPNTSALSLAPFTRNAGSASAMMGALQMGIGSLASVIVGLFHTNSALPMAIAMFGTSLIARTILLAGRKNIPAGNLVTNNNTTAVLH